MVRGFFYCRIAEVPNGGIEFGNAAVLQFGNPAQLSAARRVFMTKGRVIGAAVALLNSSRCPGGLYSNCEFRAGPSQFRSNNLGRSELPVTASRKKGYLGAMKRAWIIVAATAVMSLAIPAWAQIRGAPASVTSMAPGRSFTPGPPASVTSLGPNGYSGGCSGPFIPSAMGCTSIDFTGSPYYPPTWTGNKRHKRHHNGGAYPLYGGYGYAYAYPVAVPVEAEAEEEPEAPAPTIFENRPTSAYVTDGSRYGAHYLDSREQQKPAAPPADMADENTAGTASAVDVIPVVLVYRDGHQQEVRNYAIVGQTLYDLGTFVAHKIPLADLNLQATIKANEDRGVEFSVPASVKVN